MKNINNINTITSIINIAGVMLFAALGNNILSLTIAFAINYFIVITFMNMTINPQYLEKYAVKIFGRIFPKTIVYLFFVVIFIIIMYLTNLHYLIFKIITK